MGCKGLFIIMFLTEGLYAVSGRRCRLYGYVNSTMDKAGMNPRRHSHSNYTVRASSKITNIGTACHNTNKPMANDMLSSARVCLCHPELENYHNGNHISVWDVFLSVKYFHHPFSESITLMLAASA